MKQVPVRALARPLIASAMVLSMVLLSAAGAGGAPQAHGPDGRLPSIPARQPGPHKAVPGEVLVHFRPGKKPPSAASMGAKNVQSLSVKGWTLVRLRHGESIDQAMARFRADPSVDNVTTNHVYYSESVPSDTLFGLQWGLQNTGQTVLGTNGTAGADISATTAWDTTTGSSSIIVAIADSGVNSAHPDLAPNVIPGQNFVPDRPPTSTWDGFGHGSHVAGIVGARGNNEYGVTGVAQRISIMPIRVLDNIGEGDTQWIADGFDWAASHGAKVVNASFGGSDFDPVMQSAMASHPNTLFVVAAGNASSDNDTTPDYPCNFSLPNLICVAASDQKDHLAGFSNFGAQSVNLAAPGVNIASTYKTVSAGDGGSGYALADSPAGGYTDGADNWAQSAATITPPGGATDCTLNYRLRASLAPNDIFTAETAPASTPNVWSTVDSAGGSSGFSTLGDFESHTPAVASDGAAFRFRFRLHTDPSQTSDGVYVDNVGVTCNAGATTALPVNTFGSSLSGYTTGGNPNTWGTTSIAYTWVYMDGTSMATPMVSGAAGLLWSAHPNATVAGVKDALLRSVDQLPAFASTTSSGGRLNVASALQTIDAVAPTGVGFTPGPLSSPFQLSPSFSIGWTATDGTGTGVKSYDVRYRRARYTGTFGAWITWKSSTTATTASFPGAVGSSYCFEVRARDKVLNTSAWSAPRCTELPVNDTSLSAGPGWSRLKSSSTYLGDYTYSTTRFATLTLANAYWRQIDLVVSVCSGCGSVAVFSGSTNLGTFSTNASSSGSRHLVVVRGSTRVNGPVTITIRIVSPSTHPVRIEGLGLLQY